MTPIYIRVIFAVITFVLFVLALNDLMSTEIVIVVFIILLIVYAFLKNYFKNKKASK